MKILIIIVFFRNTSDLKNLLDDLKKFDAEICVVNNGEKKEVEFVKEFKNVELIQNEKNLGFAGGVNDGLKFADRPGGLSLRKYDLVWILNPDCRVEIEVKNWGNRRNQGNQGNQFDIFSPVVYDANGKVWFGGGKINRVTGEVTSSTTVRPCNSKTVEKKGLDSRFRGNDKTAWVSGCSMFVKPQVFEKIGFFDERFFLFYEDVDFCLRAEKEGFKIGIGGLGRIKIIHQVSMSVNQLGEKKKYEIESKSKWLFLKKHWREFYLSAFVVSWVREIKHKLI